MRHLLVLALVFLVGCASQPRRAPRVAWPFAEQVRPLITRRMLDHPPPGLCPNYASLDDPREAWVAMLGGIAWAESTWELHPKPYVEKAQGLDPVTGAPVLSQGLFQLSYQDSIDPRYRGAQACSRISWPRRNIEDEDVNIPCALAIFDYLIEEGRPVSTYWSTANPVNVLPGHDGFLTSTKKIRELLPACF